MQSRCGLPDRCYESVILQLRKHVLPKGFAVWVFRREYCNAIALDQRSADQLCVLNDGIAIGSFEQQVARTADDGQDLPEAGGERGP